MGGGREAGGGDFFWGDGGGFGEFFFDFFDVDVVEVGGVDFAAEEGIDDGVGGEVEADGEGAEHGDEPVDPEGDEPGGDVFGPGEGAEVEEGRGEMPEFDGGPDGGPLGGGFGGEPPA